MKTVSPAEFIKEDMTKKIFMKISLPALDSYKYVYRSYKIMPRAQNAHAYVNAAFLFEFDDAKENVLSARICFGGIKPDFVHAELTEKFLVGKDLYSDDVLEEALTVMTQELDPDWVLPDASPDYRKNLALSLFYKFVLNTCPEDKIKPAYKSGGTITDRVLSSGQQTFDTHERNWPVNKNVPKIEGLIQCSGEAEYTNDIAPQPHELWAAFVVGTEVHAHILEIDTTEVMEIPGVVAFYSVKDIPGKNNFMPDKIPFTTHSEELFCSGEVRKKFFFNK
jgi:xanthine dehydrogenase/oxidase